MSTPPLKSQLALMNAEVPVKVYVINKPVAPLRRGQELQILETRLIKINRTTTLAEIDSKIEQLVPVIHGKLYSVYWKDNDGDFIVLSSDEEMKLAFQTFGGGTMHLYAALDQALQTHNGVSCDGCESAPILGHRYKCVMCPNFDLCSTCEANGVHPRHVMMRIPTPTISKLDLIQLINAFRYDLN